MRKKVYNANRFHQYEMNFKTKLNRMFNIKNKYLNESKDEIIHWNFDEIYTDVDYYPYSFMYYEKFMFYLFLIISRDNNKICKYQIRDIKINSKNMLFVKIKNFQHKKEALNKLPLNILYKMIMYCEIPTFYTTIDKYHYFCKDILSQKKYIINNYNINFIVSNNQKMNEYHLECYDIMSQFNIENLIYNVHKRIFNPVIKINNTMYNFNKYNFFNNITFLNDFLKNI